MNAPANLNQRGKVLLAVITYSWQVDFRVRNAVEAACFGLASRGWTPIPTTKKCNADLEHGRNTLAAEFVKCRERFDKAVFIDGDVSCDDGSIERLVDHPVDLVLGSYRIRSDELGEKGRYALRKLPGIMDCTDPVTGAPKPDGLIRISGGPAGMMCVSRACIEKMIAADDRWYASPNVTGNKAWPLFEFDVINHERISEDMNFCRKWRALDGEVWLDPHLTLHHHGDKTYSGRVFDHLKDLDVIADGERIAKVPLENVSMADLL